MVVVSATMSDDNITPPVSSAKSVWAEDRPRGKNAEYYEELRVQLKDTFKENEFLTIEEAFMAVKKKTVSLLTSDIKSRKLIGVSRETMEEVLKVLQISPKVLARRSNAMWDILLPTEQDAKQIAGNILTTKNLRLQTEYMDTRRTRITVHGVPVDVSTDRMGAYFSKFGSVEEVKAITGKSGIATGDIELQVTITRSSFMEIPNVLLCRERRMLVVVEGRRPSCWSCGISGHMAKECPAKRPPPTKQPTPSTTTAAAVVAASPTTEATPKDAEGTWKVVGGGKKPKNVSTPPKKEDTPRKQQTPPQQRAKKVPLPEQKGEKERQQVEAPRQKGDKKQQQQQLHQHKQQQLRQPEEQQPLQSEQQQPEQDQMEVEQTPPPRATSLKRSREEDDEEPPQRHHDRGRAEKVMEQSRAISVPASFKNTQEPTRTRRHSSSPSSTTHPSPSTPPRNSVSTFPLSPTSSPPHPSREKKKRKRKTFAGPEWICKVDKEEYKKGLPKQRKTLLGGLYKMETIEGKNIEDPQNFPRAPGVITCIRETGNQLEVWNHLYEARAAFPNIRMFELENHNLKNLRQFCSGRVPVLLHPSLYRAIKLTYPTDVGGIVTEGRMTSELGVGSLGQSVGVLSPADFRPVCE